jgi:nicotinamidase-related amidase
LGQKTVQKNVGRKNKDLSDAVLIFLSYIFLSCPFCRSLLLPYFDLESDQRHDIIIRGIVMKHPSLLDRRRAALAVIDMQEAFGKIIPDFGELVERIALTVQACKLLDLPVIVTEQYPKGLGRTAPAIAGHLPVDSSPIEKLSFSACGEQEFDTRLRERHVEQVMLCGIEAHICVSQTAHDLLQNGYQVHLLSDAVSARLARNRELAIGKMAKAGAIISSIEMALFELCPAGTPEFKQMQALVKQLS